MVRAGMSGLAIVVTAADRAAPALRVAAAAAALGRTVAVHCDGPSVAALAAPAGAELAAALGLGVAVTACQSGLAEAGLDAAALAPGVETGGLVGFLGEHQAMQLLLA